jgi:NAD(P)-dependent dehydrogenase (short-subunit alcohol dehydrogenase family)
MQASVVVTGGANGIGRATSIVLARAGWTVLAADRDRAALDQLAAEQPTVHTYAGDLTDPATPGTLVAVAQGLAPLTGWVNNAGILDAAPLHQVDDESVDRVLSVNLRATILGARAAIQAFLSTGTPGSVVNVTSIHAQHPFAGHPIYAASKGAVESLTRQLCVEYAEAGIRCNAVAPGAVDTRMTLDPTSNEAAAARQRAAAAALSPAGRVSAPEEIAHAIAFLLSPEARSINGHVLAVDNGMAAHGRTPG